MECVGCRSATPHTEAALFRKKLYLCRKCMKLATHAQMKAEASIRMLEKHMEDWLEQAILQGALKGGSEIPLIDPTRLNDAVVASTEDTKKE